MADANLLVKDANADTVELKAKGDGTSADPHRTYHAVADGENVTLGAMADASPTPGDPGSISAKLRYLTTELHNAVVAIGNVADNQVLRSQVITPVDLSGSGNTQTEMEEPVHLYRSQGTDIEVLAVQGSHTYLVGLVMMATADALVTLHESNVSGTGGAQEIGPIQLIKGVPFVMPNAGGCWMHLADGVGLLVDITSSGFVHLSIQFYRRSD